MAKLIEVNGHIHHFDLVGMKVTDHFHEVQSTLDGATFSDNHGHEVFIHFDMDAGEFVIRSGPGGGSFATQHIHPEMRVKPGSLEVRKTTIDDKPDIHVV